MPVRRHGLTLTPAKRALAPPASNEARDLLGLKLPTLPEVANGLANALGLTKDKPGQQKPSTTPPPSTPSPSPPAQTPAPPKPEEPAPPKPSSPTTAPPAGPTNPSGPAPSPSQATPASTTKTEPSGSSGAPEDPEASSSGISSPSSGPGGDADDGQPQPSRGLGLIGVPKPAANAGELPGQGDDSANDGGGNGLLPGNTQVVSGRPGGKTTLPGAAPTGSTDPGSPDSPGNDHAGGAKGSNHVPIIVAAVLVGIFVLVGILFLRRRWLARRAHQRHQWWTSRKRTSKDYDDSITSSNRQSARSSFATTFDRSVHGHESEFPHGFVPDASMPAMPPMAELRRSQNMLEYPISSPTPTVVTVDSHRLSAGTDGSHVSRFLAFPVPPSGSPVKQLSPSSSVEELAPTPTIGGFTFPVLTPAQSEQKKPITDTLPDPFADPRYEPSAEGSYDTATTDPFSDSCASSSVHGVFDDTEAIQRPFVASQPDELSVNVGDQVKVIKVFTDGWVAVELEASGSDARQTKGMVPIDCLRQSGQDFQDFLQSKQVEKRISSAYFFNAV